MRVILDIANNHDGKVEHGIEIIDAFAPLVKEFPDFELAFKFQYRDPSILHPALTSKLTKRVSSTILSNEHKADLAAHARSVGFKVGCTPFDEKSATLVEMHLYDFVKVASCSLTDWPLLERIVTLGLPTIASTGGASHEDVVRATQFLQRRVPSLTLMHCVSEYPTKEEDLRLDRIDWLRTLGLPVGYSTHEDPGADIGVLMAAAKDCKTFEWHVCEGGVMRFRPNTYSLTVDETRLRLFALQRAAKWLEDKPSSQAEQDSLHGLRRGAFATTELKHYDKITLGHNAVLQLPVQPGQLLANDFSKYASFSARSIIKAGAPILRSQVDATLNYRDKVHELAIKVQAVLDTSGAVLPRPAKLVLSHHKGLNNFERVGCGQVECVNGNGYAKKLIVLLPGQSHPSHYHKTKVETFAVLSGDLILTLGGPNGDGVVVGDPQVQTLLPGRRADVLPPWKHAFSSTNGCVFEEISTECLPDDSFYDEPVDAERKTTVWLP